MTIKKGNIARTANVWMDNYNTLENSLNGQEAMSPRIRAWINYQRHRRSNLTEEKMAMLNGLIPLMGFDWKKTPVKTKRKPRKRDSIKGLGQRITAARIEAGFSSINEFIKGTTFAYSSVYDWERNISIPSLDRFLILCERLDVTADHLLFNR